MLALEILLEDWCWQFDIYFRGLVLALEILLEDWCWQFDIYFRGLVSALGIFYRIGAFTSDIARGLCKYFQRLVLAL